jgi:hypothetical protein
VKNENLRYGKAADEYSLGIALYILISGRRYECKYTYIYINIYLNKSIWYVFVLDTYLWIKKGNLVC